MGKGKGYAIPPKALASLRDKYALAYTVASSQVSNTMLPVAVSRTAPWIQGKVADVTVWIRRQHMISVIIRYLMGMGTMWNDSFFPDYIQNPPQENPEL